MNSAILKLNLRKLVMTALSLIVVFQSASALAKGKSYVCNHPDKPGGWGALDMGCDADQYGDLKRMKAIYSSLIFDRNPDGTGATDEYVTNVQATIKEIAKEYYLKRVPNAKPETLSAWMLTAVAIGAHESMLSHYRLSKDNRYKFMTGDKLVSHGIMQVNQLYHANKDFDSSFDFVGNVVAALDYYFEKWNDSIQQQCYLDSLGKNPSLNLMLANRARSAYSSYNSGSDFCRFTNLKATWARNDAHFFETLRDRPWKKHVIDDRRAAPVNVKCLMDGDDLCAAAKTQQSDTLLKNRPLLLADGNTCVTLDGTAFTCATDDRIFSCLSKIDPDIMDNKPVKLAKLPATATKIDTLKDREPICQASVKGLLKVGQMLLLKKEVLMRDDVGGSPIGNTKAGRIFQILDYDVRLGETTERYYEIQTPNGTKGWIYAGTDADHDEWSRLATAQDQADLVRADEVAKADKLAARKAAEAAAAQAKADADAQAAAEAQPDIIITGIRAKPTPGPTPVPAPDKEQTEAGKPDPNPDTLTKPAPASDLLSQVPPLKPMSTDDDDDDSDPVAVLPVKGSIIEIVKAGGIVMRSEAGEDTDKAPILQLYKGARFTVEEIAIKGTDNQIYLKVTSGDKTGWIYTGHTTPQNTVPLWTKIWK